MWNASNLSTKTSKIMKTLLLSLITLTFLFQPTLQSQEYTIDASHSAVLMKVKRFGVVNVVGRFGEVAGTITYDPNDITNTQMDIAVTVDSYTANNPGGEESARGPAFLDAANHPNLSFTLTKTMERDGKTILVGDITIKGTTKEIEFPAELIGPALDLPTRKQSIALSCMMVINRLDFNVGPTQTLKNGTEIIGNRVEISLELLGIVSN